MFELEHLQRTVEKAITDEQEAIDFYLAVEEELRSLGLTALATTVYDIRMDETRHKHEFTEMLLQVQNAREKRDLTSVAAWKNKPVWSDMAVGQRKLMLMSLGYGELTAQTYAGMTYWELPNDKVAMLSTKVRFLEVSAPETRDMKPVEPERPWVISFHRTQLSASKEEKSWKSRGYETEIRYDEKQKDWVLLYRRPSGAQNPVERVRSEKQFAASHIGPPWARQPGRYSFGEEPEQQVLGPVALELKEKIEMTSSLEETRGYRGDVQQAHDKHRITVSEWDALVNIISSREQQQG